MKIALLTDSYIPAPNGTSISVETLRRSLTSARHDVWVFAPEYRGLKIKENKIISLPGVFSTDKFKPRMWPTSGPKPQVLREAGFDILHSHHFFSPMRYSLEFAKNAGVPHAVTFYRYFPEYEVQKSSLSLTSPFQKTIARMMEVAGGANRIIALSSPSKEYLQDLGVSTPIDVAPVGIFTKDYSSYPPGAIFEKFKIPKQRKLLLYVGRLEDDCELEFLLRAFKIVWKAIDDVHLLIIGGGPKESQYKELISRQSWGEYVTLTGFLPKQQVNKIYGVADLFVYPKTLDPEPLCVLESLAAGTPVVATEGYGIGDFLRHHEEGIITKHDIDEFSRGIIELLRREKLRLEFSLRSRNRAKEFRASNTTHILLQSYESVLTGKKKTKMF